MPADGAGCTKDKPVEWIGAEGIEIAVCPVRYFGECYPAIFGAKLLEKGVLPKEGGWLDQPDLLMTAIEIANGEIKKG